MSSRGVLTGAPVEFQQGAYSGLRASSRSRAERTIRFPGSFFACRSSEIRRPAMHPEQTRLLRRRCKRCRTTYLNEVPAVLQGGEFWPSRCPKCGRLEVDFIAPANWVEPGAAGVVALAARGPAEAWKAR